ncbi:MAG: SpoVR family protein [Candidatus Niyogibacteria bacterium]|nr:MAG: SpoVR family protein [Candidatus Niyogibacteria bacterium]
MKLLDPAAKKDMEECKKRARAAGLVFPDDTLEYFVTNRDMLELSPKVMIPTLYDHWIQDLEVVRSKWIYEAFPHNPYETVINTRPPISFYNADNADWLNVMIFYHVLAHIDFFQNNIFFRKTWDDDFCGQALADKRLINHIRKELGAEKRWVDYVIEFSSAIGNLVGYYPELEEASRQDAPEVFGRVSEKTDFYFGHFLKQRYEAKVIDLKFFFDEVERRNLFLRNHGRERGEVAFFEDDYLKSRFPEFNDVFRKWKEKNHKPKPKDLFEHLAENSEFLNKEKNRWMKDVLQVVRRTNLYFQAQIRTKNCNEGWASLWHERLFIPDERIKTRETDYAKVNAGVVVDPRIGLNPYAFGKHMLEFIEDMARRGKLSRGYQLIKDAEIRKHYNCGSGEGFAKKVLFEARKYFDDRLLLNFLSDDDFQDFTDKHKFFVVGARLSPTKWGMAELYIKSKSGIEYRRLLNKHLYHPPHIVIDEKRSADGGLYLVHEYEGRTLFTKHIPEVLIGLEFLSGGCVALETTEYEEVNMKPQWKHFWEGTEPEFKKERVRYTCKDKEVERTVL